MSALICPKCGFQQDGGTECLRCGIIFSRYHDRERPAPDTGRQNQRSNRWTLFRLFRWASLALLVLALLLILIPAAPPRVSLSEDATARAAEKAQSFRASLQKGEPATLEMDEPELNGWLAANLALKPEETSAGPAKSSRDVTAAIAKRAMALPPSGGSALPGSEVSVEEVQSSVREVKIELREDDLRGYVRFEVYGKELSLELEGRLTVRDGCLALDPTAGKLGSLPLLSTSLQAAARRIFEAPENREKFRLPPEIKDVTIRQRRLVILSR